MNAFAESGIGIQTGAGSGRDRVRVFFAGEAAGTDASRAAEIVAADARFELCGAFSGRQMVDRARELKPDVVVLNISTAELNEAEVIRQMRADVPDVEVVVVSAERSEELVLKVLNAGAKSFLSHGETRRYLSAAIETLAEHKPFLTPEVSEMMLARALANQPQSTGAGSDSRLTVREAQTLRLLANGSSNKEVASALGISVRTAETHRATLMRKLGLDSIAALVRYAVRNNIVEP